MYMYWILCTSEYFTTKSHLVINKPLSLTWYNTNLTKLPPWKLTFGRATDISIAESTNKCHTPEVVKGHSAIHQVLHVDVPGFKPSHGECSSHLSVSITPLLSDYRHPGCWACQEMDRSLGKLCMFMCASIVNLSVDKLIIGGTLSGCTCVCMWVCSVCW